VEKNQFITVAMAKIDTHFFDFGYLDKLSYQQSPIHRLDPRAKLVTTLVFITTVVSFGKYEISALLPYLLFPVVMCGLGDLPPAYLLKKILLVSPFALLIGIFNPLMDRAILIHLGGWDITGGWVSFVSILLRFLLTVGAALILIAVTGFNAVCMGLEKLGTPRVFVVQLMFLYRYIFVLVDEASRMVRARSLRSFGRSGAGLRIFGNLVGHLLLRTMDRAQRVHLAMLCRGFDGQIHILKPLKIGPKEICFVLGWSALFVSMRFYNFPQLVGAMVTELLK
jgi:cobalt/nickel transport system permease protein